jgi:hypothetical protein
MKKFLKIFGISLAALIVLIFGIGIFLPKQYHVERSIVIAKPDTLVYNYLAEFNNFNNWSPWNDMEPDIEYKIEGKSGTVGCRYSWEGEKMGEGYLEIIELNPYKVIEQKLVFKKPMENEALTSFVLSREPNGTKVTWDIDGENKSIPSRWFCLMMKNMIGKDYEKGLIKLKQQIEKL